MEHYGQKGSIHRGGITIDEELLLSHVGLQLEPITVDYTAQIKKILKGTLYGRQTASPGKYVPFLTLALIASSTNSTNYVATLSLALEAGIFSVADTVKFWDTSAGAFISDSSGDPITVDAVDPTAGNNTVTCTGEVFTANSAAGDYLVIWDGSQDEANIMMVMEDIDFSALTADIHTYAVYAGMIKETKVLRLWDDNSTPHLYLTKSNVQRLQFLNRQL